MQWSRQLVSCTLQVQAASPVLGADVVDRSVYSNYQLLLTANRRLYNAIYLSIATLNCWYQYSFVNRRAYTPGFIKPQSP